MHLKRGNPQPRHAGQFNTSQPNPQQFVWEIVWDFPKNHWTNSQRIVNFNSQWQLFMTGSPTCSYCPDSRQPSGDLFDQVTWKSCWKSCWLAAVVHFVYAGQCCNSFQVRAFNVHWCDWSTCMARCSFDKIRVIFRVAILHSISSFGQNLPFCWRQWPWPKWRKRRWPKREFQIVLSDLFANLAMFHPILVDAHPPSGK